MARLVTAALFTALLMSGCDTDSESQVSSAEAPQRAEPLEISDREDFDSVVLERSASVPVAVMFTAEWSGPDRIMRPTLTDVVEGRDDLDLVFVDVDDNADLAEEYEVLSIPTVSVFIDGEPVNRIVGALPEARLARELDKALTRD